jgi:phosphate transport system substrate-binding protein
MKTNPKKIILISMGALLVLSMILSACGKAPEVQEGTDLEGTITISGAFALYPMMQRWAEEFQKIHPGVEFDISAGGAGKGMTDTLAGAVDIGMISRSITPEEEAKGAFWVAVTKDAVFPVVNAKNPVLQDLLDQGVTRDIFEQIYITGEITNWGQVVGKPEVTEAINVYTRSDAAGAPDIWAKYLGKKQEDLKGLGVFGDPGLLDAVIKDPRGIGFNNLNYAFDNASGLPVAGAVVVPIDVNENGKADPEEVLDTKAKADEAVKNGTYPSPPARLENLATKGKPGPLAMEFIKWILTDGQQYVGEAGYVQLTPEQLQESLNKLNQ